MTVPGIANPLGAPAFLALAALLALYLRVRRRQAIPVATLFLWRRVRAPVVPPRRFRPDAVFWLQVAILAALAAGYVRPYVDRATGAAPQARLLVLLDVSASMQAREPEGVRFDLARARAEREIARLASSDEAMLVTAGARAGVVLRWSTDRTLARRRLEELSALDVPTDLAPALELALSEGRARAGTRILVLTDLPAAESGLAAADLAAVEWTRIGRTDNNVGIVGVSVDEPPFADARAASVLVLVRNFARAPRRVVLTAGAGGTPWERRELTLGARGSASVTLRTPPASGALELGLDGDDALAVDDRAWGWIGAHGPMDAVVVTRSPALALTFERLAAGVSGGRITRLAPEEWTPGATAGHRLAVLDGFVPPEEPDGVGALYVAPPPGNLVCPTAATAAADVSVVDWDGDHPILRGMDGLPSLTLARASALAVPGWGRSVVLGGSRTASVPILVAGETRGRRVACLAAPLGEEPLASDRLPLLLLALGTLRWLDDGGGPLAVATGDAVPIAAGTGEVAGVRVAGDPPVMIAERTGIHRLPAADGERIVTANLVDERESDIGRDATPDAPAAPFASAHEPLLARYDVTGWLFALGLLALVAEWGLWTRRAGA
jgi:hypothetical protein